MKKRLMSLMIALCLVVGLFAVTAFAAEGDVAMIGDQGYATLQDAINDAYAGETIVLLKDIAMTDDTIIINEDDEVVLDLNGKTVSGVFFMEGATALIKNNGKLTITDSSDDASGKITVLANMPDTDWNPEGFPTYANNTVNNYGTLIVENGIIENTTEGGACYAIDNYTNGSVIIRGGKVYHPTKVAIRQFANSTTQKNDVTITGGEVIGGTRAVWMHLPGSSSTSAKLATLTVTGGVLTSEDTQYNLAVYVYSYGDSAENVRLDFSGDAVINGNVAINGTATATMTEQSVSVTGGSFYGEYGVFSYADEDANNSISITGGVFATTYSEMYALDDNYAFCENSNGTYGLLEVTDEAVANKSEVRFSVAPVDAVVEVMKGDRVIRTGAGPYELTGGDYTYTVSKYGYITETGFFTVAGDDLTINVNLTYIPNILAMIVGAEAPADRFSDVDANAWYYDAVNYAVESGLMTGMSEDAFAPNGTMTRAMVWTVLGRMAGQEFNGIGTNWYTEAQNWAIAAGVSDGSNPNGAITREELVTMLWRFVGQPEAEGDTIRWYNDDETISDWAKDAMAWAVENNIIQGTDFNLNPAETALRAQVAAILMRYCKF